MIILNLNYLKCMCLVISDVTKRGSRSNVPRFFLQFYENKFSFVRLQYYLNQLQESKKLKKKISKKYFEICRVINFLYCISIHFFREWKEGFCLQEGRSR